MSNMEVIGVHFHYALFGEGKWSVIFMAGYTCDIDFWRQLAQTASRDYRVFSFDNQAMSDP